MIQHLRMLYSWGVFLSIPKITLLSQIFFTLKYLLYFCFKNLKSKHYDKKLF